MTKFTAQAVWDLCHDIYLNHDIKLTLPANTAPERTYQWRYVTTLADRFNEWEFDRAIAARFLDIVLDYARSKKMLRKGLAVHFQTNLLELCYDRLQAQLEISTGDLHGLRKSKRWTESIQGDRLQVLTRCENYGGHTNLVKWYKAGRFTELYLALSREVGRAIRRLPSDERDELPNDQKLYLIRDRFLSLPENRCQALEIMQGDLKNASQVSYCS